MICLESHLGWSRLRRRKLHFSFQLYCFVRTFRFVEHCCRLCCLTFFILFIFWIKLWRCAQRAQTTGIKSLVENLKENRFIRKIELWLAWGVRHDEVRDERDELKAWEVKQAWRQSNQRSTKARMKRGGGGGDYLCARWMSFVHTGRPGWTDRTPWTQSLWSSTSSAPRCTPAAPCSRSATR